MNPALFTLRERGRIDQGRPAPIRNESGEANPRRAAGIKRTKAAGRDWHLSFSLSLLQPGSGSRRGGGAARSRREDGARAGRVSQGGAVVAGGELPQVP